MLLVKLPPVTHPPRQPPACPHQVIAHGIDGCYKDDESCCILVRWQIAPKAGALQWKADQHQGVCEDFSNVQHQSVNVCQQAKLGSLERSPSDALVVLCISYGEVNPATATARGPTS